MYGAGNMSKNNHKQAELKNWTMTPWTMNGRGGWKQQPVILIEGETPFFAAHPKAYIEKLREMYADKTLLRGPFWTTIGQLKDGMELAWCITSTPLLEVNHEKSLS